MNKFQNTKIFRPAWIDADLDAIAQNVQNIKKFIGDTQLLAVVKADGYGLGVIPISQTVLENGADKLGVIMLDEAIELRQAGITAPILNMGPVFPDQAETVLELKLEQMVHRQDVAQALSKDAGKMQTTAQVHIKIDTGMSRYGVHFSEAAEHIIRLSKFDHMEIVGAFTHFAKSDAVDKSFPLLQIERFKNIRRELQSRGVYIPTWHMANSGGTLDLPESHFDMVRVGLMNYGYFPSQDVQRPFDLYPAMHVRAKIVAIREIHRGDTVGYGRKYMAERNERIAVLPIGYADGYDRKLSKIGQVLLNGRMAPIIGGLCMDAAFIKITEFPDADIGDTVTLMGTDGEEEISPHFIAELTNTVSYEVISTFGRRLPRVYWRNGKVVKVDNRLLQK